MYVVLVKHKSREPLSDCIPELKLKFPEEVFSVFGSDEKGYQLRIEGMGDEVLPRKFAETFLKTWKPKPSEPEETK